MSPDEMRRLRFLAEKAETEDLSMKPTYRRDLSDGHAFIGAAGQVARLADKALDLEAKLSQVRALLESDRLPEHARREALGVLRG